MVGDLARAGRATSTRRNYLQVFKGFHRFLEVRKAVEIEAAFGVRLVCPVDEYNSARHVSSDSPAQDPPPAPERILEFFGFLKARIGTARKYAPAAEFSGKWEKRYPAIIRLWENAWAEFVPFLQSGREIRTVICTTNAIESINARLRRAVNARGHFPTEQAALKCLYLAIMSLDPTGKGRKRWTNRWKAALNAFDITFDGRLSAGRK